MTIGDRIKPGRARGNVDVTAGPTTADQFPGVDGKENPAKADVKQVGSSADGTVTENVGA